MERPPTLMAERKRRANPRGDLDDWEVETSDIDDQEKREILATEMERPVTLTTKRETGYFHDQ